jgi:hypothetical protein
MKLSSSWGIAAEWISYFRTAGQDWQHKEVYTAIRRIYVKIY